MKNINRQTEGTAATIFNSMAQDKNEHIYNLSAGDLNLDYSPLLKGGISSAIKQNIHNYSSTQGLLSLRKKINYNPNQVLITNGAKSAIFTALMATCKAGDEVQIIGPAWPSYIEMCKLLGLKHNLILDNNLNHITKNTSAVIINNPNNPTGKVYSEKEINLLHKHCIKANCWIISDECYSDIIYDNKEFYSLKNKENTIYINSFSKSMSISGWRFGYAIGPEDVIKQMTLIQSQINGPPNSLIQYAILKNYDYLTPIELTELNKRRELLASINQNFYDSKPDGGLYFYMYLNEYKSLNVVKELFEKYNILTTPGDQYGDSNTIRLSFANITLKELETILPILDRSIK